MQEIPPDLAGWLEDEARTREEREEERGTAQAGETRVDRSVLRNEFFDGDKDNDADEADDEPVVKKPAARKPRTSTGKRARGRGRARGATSRSAAAAEDGEDEDDEDEAPAPVRRTARPRGRGKGRGRGRGRTRAQAQERDTETESTQLEGDSVLDTETDQAPQELNVV